MLKCSKNNISRKLKFHDNLAIKAIKIMYGKNYGEIVESQTDPGKSMKDISLNQYHSLKKLDLNNDFELSQKNIFKKNSYPIDLNSVNCFCPICGKFVQKQPQFLTLESKSHHKNFLAHQKCLTNQFEFQMNGIYEQIQESIIKVDSYQKGQKMNLMVLGNRQFYIELTVSHPLSDFKFLKLSKKIPLIGSKIYWDIREQDNNIFDYQPNIICIPFSDFKLTIYLSQIGLSQNKTKIQTYINLYKSKSIKSKKLTAISESINLQIEKIEDLQEKKKLINQMNFKYAYQKLPLSIIELRRIQIQLPQEFEEEQNQYQHNPGIQNLLDEQNFNSILSGSHSGTQKFSKNETTFQNIYSSEVLSEKSFEGQQKVDLQMLINTNQLKLYVCNSTGSRYFQNYLKDASSEQVDIIINNLYPDLPQLTKHDYANYMVQKVFSACNVKQRIHIMKKLLGEIASIVKNKQGTHTIQAFISLFTNNEQFELMCQAIEPDFISLCMNSNSTHFIQKIINIFPIQYTLKFFQIVSKDNKNFICFATDKNAMCVLKHMMRKFKHITSDHPLYYQVNELKKQFIHSITFNTDIIIQDSYGNYIVQFCYEQFGQSKCEGISEMIVARFSQFAIQKYSSSVVLKCISTYWKDIETIEKLKFSLSSEAIIEIYRNRDGNKILLQIMQKYQNTLIRAKIFNLLISGQPTKFYHDRWGSALGCRSGNVGTPFNNFSQATQSNPYNTASYGSKSNRKKYH